MPPLGKIGSRPSADSQRQGSEATTLRTRCRSARKPVSMRRTPRRCDNLLGMKHLPGQADRSYGDSVNQEFLDFLGPLRGTVVDVGSGIGNWSSILRERGAVHLVSIEPSQDAELARRNYDLVFKGPLNLAPQECFENAELIILADVLEHLVDPWTDLRYIRENVVSGTLLAICVPNLQCARMLLPALLSGAFRYSDDGGWLDRGHLRWFTSSTLNETLHMTGWKPIRYGGRYLGRSSAGLYHMTRGRAWRLAFFQLYVIAAAV